jgi:flagellar basal-body rod modification protein FlgD
MEFYDGDSPIGTRVVPAYSQITEVRSDGGGVMVRLSDGSELPADLISGLRAPWA